MLSIGREDAHIFHQWEHPFIHKVVWAVFFRRRGFGGFHNPDWNRQTCSGESQYLTQDGSCRNVCPITPHPGLPLTHPISYRKSNEWGKLCFWLTRKAAYRGAGSVDGHLLQAVRNREGRCRVGGGRCTLNQARQVLGECVWCYNLLIKGLSHVVTWKLEHIA